MNKLYFWILYVKAFVFMYPTVWEFMRITQVNLTFFERISHVFRVTRNCLSVPGIKELKDILKAF